VRYSSLPLNAILQSRLTLFDKGLRLTKLLLIVDFVRVALVVDVDCARRPIVPRAD
jgi:hypothetical protein